MEAISKNTILELIYDGTTDPKSFIQQYKIQALFQSWDSAKQLENLPLFLTGKAKRTFDNIADKSSLENVYKAIIDGCSQSKETLMLKFYERKRGASESILKYATALQELLAKAMPDMPTDQQTVLLRSQLCLGLPEHIRAFITFNPRMTWDELLKCLENTVPSSAALSQQHASSFAAADSLDINFSDATQHRNDRRPNQRPQRNESRPFNGNCNYCNSFGHKIADCRKRQREQQQHASSFRPAIRQHNVRFEDSQRETIDVNQRGRQRAAAHSNTNSIAASSQDSQLNSSNEFPFFATDTNVLEIATLSLQQTTCLLKKHVNFSLFDKPTQSAHALIDGGSSHSFISPNILTSEQVKIAADKSSKFCSRQNFIINGATGQAKSQCCIVSCQLRINAWQGQHTFIISGAVTKHDMIIGRDFFKQHRVKVDHADDSLTIDDIKINAFSIDATQAALVSAPQAALVSAPQAALVSAPQVAQDRLLSCFVATTTIVEPHSQRLVELNSQTATCKPSTPTLLFEPAHPMPRDSLIARSAHASNASSIYCNVLNAGEKQLVLKAGQQLGHLSEIDEANIKFNEDILSYEPLDTDKLLTDCTPSDTTTLERIKSLNICQSLSSAEQDMLRAVLARNSDAFQWTPGETGRTKLVEHTIPTGDNGPVRQKQYPIPSIAREPLNEQVQEMLDKQIIRPSSSSWRSPVLLVKKKQPDGTCGYRFCIDLKQVNSVTAKDCYALPLISRTVDALSGANYFTTLDVNRAFWQVGVAEQDKHKLAFSVDGKLYEFNVMPFGSMNAPSTFQRLVDRVLHGLTWKQCLVYIDDVLIFAATFIEHLRALDEVLFRFRAAGIKLKPSKCVFGKQEVEYLGYNISRQGIQPLLKRVEAILRVEPPSTTSKLYSFLCSVNYYRPLIPNYGRITFQLYEMARSCKKTCKWDENTLKCFAALKHALATAPILAFPDFSKPFVFQTDASDWAIAAVLLQEFATILKPIAFASRKLSPTEHRYTVSERELLAIVYGYDQFYSYIYGRKITIYTDHEPLVTSRQLNNANMETKRLARLFHRLQDVDYELRHIAGADNHLPDFLSRSYKLEPADVQLNYTEIKSSINWANEQLKDAEIVAITKLVRASAPDQSWLSAPNGRRWLHERRNLYLGKDGSLMHSKSLIVCPSHLTADIMRLHHDPPLSGHRGAQTTLESIKRRYYWNYMPRQVKEYCRSCPSCQQYNYSCLHNRAPLKPICVSRPWQLVGVDFMGPFKTSRAGNNYIVLAVDHLTKYAEGAATPSFDATTTAAFLFNNIVCRFGMVEQVLSDQGVNFESKLIKQLCALIGTDKLHTSTYHPAGNGITERLNRTIKPSIAKLVNDDHDDWDMFLPMVISSYNNSFHDSIKMSPYEAQFGRPPVLVHDVINGNHLPTNTKLRDISEYVTALRRSANHIAEVLRANTAAAQARQKSYYDRFTHSNATFEVGDFVKINNCRRHIGQSKAFEPKFVGPYKIAKKLGDLNYLIQSPTLRPEIVHYNRLSHYRIRDEERLLFEAAKPRTPARQERAQQEIVPTMRMPLIRRNRNAVEVPSRAHAPARDARSTDTIANDMSDTSGDEAATSTTRTFAVTTATTSTLNDVVAGRSSLVMDNIQEVMSKLRPLPSRLAALADAVEYVNIQPGREQTNNNASESNSTATKPRVTCPKCHNEYEAKLGIHVHLAKCKA